MFIVDISGMRGFASVYVGTRLEVEPGDSLAAAGGLAVLAHHHRLALLPSLP
jgi:hypothetical protein